MKLTLYIVICLALFAGGFATCYYTNRKTDILTEYKRDTVIATSRDTIRLLEQQIKNNYITTYKTRTEYAKAPIHIQDSLWLIAYARADSVLQHIDSTSNR